MTGEEPGCGQGFREKIQPQPDLVTQGSFSQFPALDRQTLAGDTVDPHPVLFVLPIRIFRDRSAQHVKINTMPFFQPQICRVRAVS